MTDCLKQFKDTNSLLQQRLEHTDTNLNQKLQQTTEALSSKTIELDHLKAEWTAKMNDLAAKHKHEMATEKEKAIRCRAVISRDKKGKEKTWSKLT